jgi:beta-lactamase superfamily II metal-dependent hydrolase
MMLEYGSFRALVPIGLDFDTLRDLCSNRGLREIDGLLLAESGYAPLNPPDWIGHLRPRLSVLSVGADDREGLPSPETLAALDGYPLLRTDRNGWVEIVTDGERMWVAVERR